MSLKFNPRTAREGGGQFALRFLWFFEKYMF